MSVYFFLLFLSCASISMDDIPTVPQKDLKDFLEKNNDRIPIKVSTSISKETIEQFSKLEGLLVPFHLEKDTDPKEEFYVYPIAIAIREEVKTVPIKFKEKDFEIQKFTESMMKTMHDGFVLTDNKMLQQNFAKIIVQNKKKAVVLFEGSEKKSFAFRAFSHLKIFQEEFSFLIWNDDLEPIKAQFRIEKLPSVLIFQLSEPKVDEKDGKEKQGIAARGMTGVISYKNLLGFLYAVTKDDKKFKPKEDEAKEEKANIQYENDIEVIDSAQAKGFSANLANCEKNLCVIAFDSILKKEEAQTNKTIEILKAVQSKYPKKMIRVFLFDAICYLDQLNELGLQVDFLPTAAIYNSTKPSRFPVMGRFTEDTIINSIKMAMNERVKPIPMNEKLKMPTHNCLQANVKYDKKMEDLKKKSAEEDDDDILEEIRKEAEERAKANLEASKSKSKKKKRDSDL